METWPFFLSTAPNNPKITNAFSSFFFFPQHIQKSK